MDRSGITSKTAYKDRALGADDIGFVVGTKGIGVDRGRWLLGIQTLLVDPRSMVFLDKLESVPVQMAAHCRA
jgi:hypothetical protein